MLGAGKIVAGGLRPPVFRSSGQTASGASNVATKPAGIAVGDIVFVAQPSNGSTSQTLTTTSGSAWSKVSISSGGEEFNVHGKVLTALDVSNNWTLTNDFVHGAAAVAYQPVGGSVPLAFASKDTDTTSAATMTLNGFTRNGAFLGAISVVIDRDADLSDIGTPSGWTGDAEFDLALYQIAFASNGLYIDGSDVTWTGLNGAGGLLAQGYLLEVTG